MAKSTVLTDLKQDHVCAPFTQIPNCIEYVVDVETIGFQNADKSNFQCAACASSFYVSGVINNECKERTSEFQINCSVTNTFANECEVCELGFYLSPIDKSCIP